MTDDRFDPNTLRLHAAQDLNAIRQMYRDLAEQALARAGDPHIPGGTAMVMLGPGADVEAFSWRQLAAINGADVAVEMPQHGDIETPLAFLASWTDMVRERRVQPTALRATIEREVDYLAKSLDWMLSLDGDGEMVFLEVEDFAAGLKRLRNTMENVLYAGHRPDLAKACCMYCETGPRLHRIWMRDPKQDHWQCPACYRAYDDDGARRCLHHELDRDGAEKWVWVEDARSIANVDRRTWWSWLDRGQVRTERQGQRVMAWWPDVRERMVAREAHKARRKAVAS